MGNSKISPTATIANGASLSGVVGLGAEVSIAVIIMPAAWTAADLTFQGSIDGTTFYDVYNDAGDEYLIPTAASRIIILNVPLSFFYAKIRSGTTGSPVTQAAARTITLICL